MKMTRRTFNIGALALLVSGSAATEGCSWEHDLLAWIPVGIAAVNSFLSLLAGAGIILGPGVTAIIGLIQAGFADLAAAITEYQSTTPPPAGALAKIDTFLADLVSNWSSVVNALPPIVGVVAGLVTSMVELVIGTIQGFIASLPASAPMPKTTARLRRTFTFKGQPLVITPQKRSRRQFVRSWNGILADPQYKHAKMPESLWDRL